MSDVIEFVREFVQRALSVKTESKTCHPPPGALAVPSRIYGWSFALAAFEHPSSGPTLRDTIASGTGADYQPAPERHFHLSAKIGSSDRAPTEEDWNNLASVVRKIVRATGYPADVEYPGTLLPIEDTPPNGTIHWMWHSDGYDIDPKVIRGTIKALAAAQQQERQAAATAAATKPETIEAGRNELCPCGSGKKFKKCHGGN